MGGAYGVKPITDTEIKKTFGENLKALRQNAGLSRNELAKKFSLTALSIGAYERGLRIPTPQTLFAMADFFNVSVDELLGHGDYIPSRQVVIDEYRLNQSIHYLLGVCHIIWENASGEFVLEVLVKAEEFLTGVDGVVRRLKGDTAFICFGGASDLVDFTENVVQTALDSNKTFKEVFDEKAENLFINSDSMNTAEETKIKKWGRFRIAAL